MKDMNATLTMSMRADSGYQSEETHRVSPDQWERIQRIVAEPVGAQPIEVEEENSVEIFARLEIIAGRQILAELIADDDGPKVRFRRELGVTMEVKFGWWSDDDDGWLAAERLLRNADLIRVAADMDLSAARVLDQPTRPISQDPNDD